MIRKAMAQTLQVKIQGHRQLLWRLKLKILSPLMLPSLRLPHQHTLKRLIAHHQHSPNNIPMAPQSREDSLNITQAATLGTLATSQ